MARHGIGKPLNVRIYMEGRLIESAGNNIQVSGHTGSPSTAQIELVPTNTIKHILPGTWIHIFTTDPWDLSPAGDVSDFKLLFEGVVVAKGFTKKDDSRSFVVQCADPSIYWVNARQYWINLASANGGIVDQIAVQTSGGYGSFGTLASTGTFGYMVSELAYADKDKPEERFIDTLIQVLDDIGNVNPFYTNIRNRLRLTDRILRAPAGKTEQLFQLAVFSDFLEGLAGRQSGQSNLAQVVNQLLSAIMHEWVSVPAPPFIKGARIFDRDVFGNIKRKKTTVKRKSRKGQKKVDLYEHQTATDDIVGSIIFKPHIYTIAPPTCNVLFPNMYDQLSFSENYMNETTRMSMRPQLPLVSAQQTQGLLFQRPTELEIFASLTHDPKTGSAEKRSADAEYGDRYGQVPTFTDYDWMTNEERIRGIVYDFVNLAPAPSTLTLTSPGEKQTNGSRKGGAPKYLKNVASYEYYKSKFQHRQTGLSGPYNIRVVPGFPMLILDDSAADMNIIAYLSEVTHSISADGSAVTSYGIRYPRMVDEVDYNRPRFKGSPKDGTLDFDLLRDDEGKFHFETIFDGANQPPIPGWFDETFKNNVDLDVQYSKWFGEDCRVVQHILFKDPSKEEAQEIAAQQAAKTAALDALEADAISGADELPSSLADDILEENEKITLSDTVVELNRRFSLARGKGREFEEVASFTNRSFTRIDEAFRFVGASPLELSDPVKKEDEEKVRSKGRTFRDNPASGRTINYATAKLDFFVGDVSAGSGYTGVPDGDKPPDAEKTSTDTQSGAVETTSTKSQVEQSRNRMAGAFPIFDTKIHTDEESTDKKVRLALTDTGGEAELSDYARYDGRPLMYDFEFRLWQNSLFKAGFAPTGEKIGDAAEVADYYVVKGGYVRPATPEEQAASAEKRKARVEQRKREEAERVKRGRHNPAPSKCPNMPPSRQAPTGDELEQEQKDPLVQPLSEKQVVDLRRAVVDAYREELAKNRGFTG